MFDPTRTPLLAAAVLLISITGCSDQPASPSASEAVTDAPDEFEKQGPQIPFSEAEVFFEFNATDHDLGLQIFLDGEDWRKVKVLDPSNHKVVEIEARGELSTLGITELRFESAEPTPQEVLDRFAPGEYRFSGMAVEGEVLFASDDLSHELPDAPRFSPSAGELVDPEDLVVEWDAMPGLAGIQVIVVNDETGASLEIDLPGDATRLRVPTEFLARGTDHKAEVLAIAHNGNKTITEGTFTTMP